MRYLILFPLIMSVVTDIFAEPLIKSCDGKVWVRDDGHGVITIRQFNRVDAIKVSHGVDGGVVSLDDSLLVVFGLSVRASSRNPQITALSVYRLGGFPKPIFGKIFGGGVYSAEFGVNQRYIFVSHRYGAVVFDLIGRKYMSHDFDYTPEFPLQRCVGM